jgi:hypothetical protein
VLIVLELMRRYEYVCCMAQTDAPTKVTKEIDMQVGVVEGVVESPLLRGWPYVERGCRLGLSRQITYPCVV